MDLLYDIPEVLGERAALLGNPNAAVAGRNKQPSVDDRLQALVDLAHRLGRELKEEGRRVSVAERRLDVQAREIEGLGDEIKALHFDNEELRHRTTDLESEMHTLERRTKKLAVGLAISSVLTVGGAAGVIANAVIVSGHAAAGAAHAAAAANAASGSTPK